MDVCQCTKAGRRLRRPGNASGMPTVRRMARPNRGAQPPRGSQWPNPVSRARTDRIHAQFTDSHAARLGVELALAGPCVRSCVYVPRPFFEWDGMGWGVGGGWV